MECFENLDSKIVFEHERDDYYDRKQKLDELVYRLDNDLEPFISTLNRSISLSMECVHYGISGRDMSFLDIEQEAEKNAMWDHILSECREELSEEIKRCEDEIEELDWKISNEF